MISSFEQYFYGAFFQLELVELTVELVEVQSLGMMVRREVRTSMRLLFEQACQPLGFGEKWETEKV